MNIFRTVKKRSKVEVGDVITCKFSAGCREDAVNLQFDKFQGPSVSHSIAQVTNSIPANGDSCAVWVFFWGSYLAYHVGVRDICMAVSGDDMKQNGAECVGTRNALLSRVRGVSFPIPWQSHPSLLV